MVTGIHHSATGFERAADDYRRARPGYPTAIVDRLAEVAGIGPGRRVLDLGAGTGVLTIELLDRGAEVLAIEPVAGMRAVLREAAPAAGIVAARAEALPVGDASVDTVTVAQAFHWFDARPALAEQRRVLRTGGWLVVLFNIRDLDDDLQAALDELLLPHRDGTPSWTSGEWRRALQVAEGFGAPQVDTEPHVHHLDAGGLWARVSSVSFVARLDEATRRGLRRQVDRLFADHAVDGRVGMPYRAELHLLERR